MRWGAQTENSAVVLYYDLHVSLYIGHNLHTSLVDLRLITFEGTMMTVSSINNSRLGYTESEEFDPIMMTRTQSFHYGSKSMDDNSLVCSSEDETIGIEETRDMVEEIRAREEIRVIGATYKIDELGSESHRREEMSFGTNSDASPSMGLGDEETKFPGEQKIESDALEKLHDVQSLSKGNIGTRNPYAAGLAFSASKDAVEALLAEFPVSFSLSTNLTDDSALIIPRLDESERTEEEPLLLKRFVRIVESMLGDEPMLEMRKSAAAQKS
jgi:hypothetical protein